MGFDKNAIFALKLKIFQMILVYLKHTIQYFLFLLPVPYLLRTLVIIVILILLQAALKRSIMETPYYFLKSASHDILLPGFLLPSTFPCKTVCRILYLSFLITWFRFELAFFDYMQKFRLWSNSMFDFVICILSPRNN